MKNFDYVILGAGLGGLSAAACLTRQGYRVAVLEQHYLPGGCCYTFNFGDYSFCADVHYIYQCGEGHWSAKRGESQNLARTRVHSWKWDDDSNPSPSLEFDCSPVPNAVEPSYVLIAEHPRLFVTQTALLHRDFAVGDRHSPVGAMHCFVLRYDWHEPHSSN